MEDNILLTMLLDFYGALLTRRQREALSLHLEEDFSYSEIAQEMGISRQGAADAAGVAREALLHYEEKLNLFARHRRAQALIAQAIAQAEKLPGADELLAILSELREEDEHGI